MTTIKLPVHTTLSEVLTPGIGVGALILCVAIGSKIGRVAFGASEDAWTFAYQYGMALSLVFFFIANRKPFLEKALSRQHQLLSRQYPLWVFLSTIIFSFLLCEAFKMLHF
jgi:hypothetical protein